MECAVCFSETETGVSCCRFACNVRVCSECINGLVSHSYQNYRLVPICVGDGCDARYLWSDIKTVLTESTAIEYQRICEKELTDRAANLAKERADRQRMREAFIREARAKFDVTLSAAISTLIRISGLEDRMKKIRTENAKRTTRCVSFSCSGLLDTNGACTKCSIKVCGDCLAVAGPDHRCKEEDVASVEALAKITRCPKCKSPVTKDVGCNYVTCPYCNVNFNITTGAVTLHGGHNKEALKPIERASLADDFEDGAMKTLILAIERQRPIAKRTSDWAVGYEQRTKRKLYGDCVLLMYDYRSQGKLTEKLLVEMLRFVEKLNS